MREGGGLGRRDLLVKSSVLAASLAAPGLACTPAKHRTDGRPNVLLIVTDDHPLDTEWALPTLVRWMRDRGTTFTNGFVTTPLCTPSRASILSGRYAHNHGLLINGGSDELDQDATVTPYLRAAGYRTGLVGKFLHAWGARPPAHFEEFAIMSGGRYRNVLWNINGASRKLQGYTTRIVSHQAVEFIRRAKDDVRPWFLCVTPFAAHRPYVSELAYRDVDVPEWDPGAAVEESDRRDKPAYVQDTHSKLAVAEEIRAKQLRTLRSVDDLVRAIRSELTAQDVLENTLVVFVGDNGYAWADHGLIGKALPYASSVRVPFYLSWPASGVKHGRTDDRLAANIDIAPTILDAAGIRQDYVLDGRSLLASGTRDRLLLEWWRGDRAWNHGADSWASTITPEYQYIEYYDVAVQSGTLTGDGAVRFREYYDLARDPDQLTNLLHGETTRQIDVAALSAELRADRKCSGRECS